jgi:hypothetical protein
MVLQIGEEKNTQSTNNQTKKEKKNSQHQKELTIL